jgi:hypothetical protein
LGGDAVFIDVFVGKEFERRAFRGEHLKGACRAECLCGERARRLSIVLFLGAALRWRRNEDANSVGTVAVIASNRPRNLDCIGAVFEVLLRVLRFIH